MKTNYNYAHYKNLGGIISEKDYENAFNRIEGIDGGVREMFMDHAKLIAGFAEIMQVDEVAFYLYAALRSDTAPAGGVYHYSDMSDQRLFAEVLLIVGNVRAFEKMRDAYGNISFS